MRKVLLFSSKKASPYGNELVVNGGFDTDSDWSDLGNWSIADGVATYDALGSAKRFFQVFASPITIGTTIKIDYDVTWIAEGKQAYFRITGNSNGVPLFINYTLHDVGSYSVEVTVTDADATMLYFLALNSGNGGAFSIDNVSVKEII